MMNSNDYGKLMRWLSNEEKDHPEEVKLVKNLIIESNSNQSMSGKVTSPGLDRMEDRDFLDSE